MLMANIPQKSLLDWKKIENLGDLRRLQFVLENLPDEHIMKVLEKNRGNGRDDYPVRAIWNSCIAGIVYQHESIESLRRELLRNGQLRDMCGFDPIFGENAVPPAWAYTRFLKNLCTHAGMLYAIFEDLVDTTAVLLSDFGEHLGMDGKWIDSHGKKSKHTVRDGRRDLDADYGVKTYSGIRDDGSTWKTIKRCFGYQVNLLADTKYELPIGFTVTPASASEVKQVNPIFDNFKARHPDILDRSRYFIADKAYDSAPMQRKLFRDHNIVSIIKVRSMWKDGEATKQVPGFENIVYDYKGKISCIDMMSGEQKDMVFGGYEKDRQTLKYCCPAKYYGLNCRHIKECGIKKAVRIKISLDDRIFKPVARGSRNWKKLYRQRSAVERINSRLDVSFGFERHYIRGIKKMRMRVTLAMIVMLSLAVGHIKSGQNEKMRTLARAG